MQSITIGMDLGDKRHQLFIFDSKGRVMRTCQISNTLNALRYENIKAKDTKTGRFELTAEC